MDGWIDGWIDAINTQRNTETCHGCMDGWHTKRICYTLSMLHGWMHGCMHGCMHARLKHCKTQRNNGWTRHTNMDGCMEICTHFKPTIFKSRINQCRLLRVCLATHCKHPGPLQHVLQYDMYVGGYHCCGRHQWQRRQPGGPGMSYCLRQFL